jgi:hypothetical protein
MEIANKDLSTDAFVHTLVSSELNTRYIQPSYALSDNIISHSVPFSVVEKIKTYYESRYFKFTSYLKTNYYELNKVYSVKENLSGIKNSYTVIYRNDYKILEYLNSNSQFTLEYVGENQFSLNKETFQIKKSYDHERQSLIEVIDTYHFTLELEGLLTGLKTYTQRGMHKLVDEKFDSYSFKFFIKQGMSREELQDHVIFLSNAI